jgi:hypothetical protein
MKNSSKYVVLEHLTLPDRGRRFWTTNTENNTHSLEGELWYKEIMFTDSEDDAIHMSRSFNKDTVATLSEIYNHRFNKP